MIEFRKVDDPEDDRDHQLLIDNILLDKVSVKSVHGKNEGETYFSISTKDIDSGRRMATCSLGSLLPIEYIQFAYYLDDLKPLSDNCDVFIAEDYIFEDPDHHLKHLGTYNCLIYIRPNLAEWRQDYTFADYAISLYQSFRKLDSFKISLLSYEDHALNKKRAGYDDGFPKFLDVDISQVEKRHIHNISIEFPYPSPKARIDDVLKRFSVAFQSIHREVIDLLTSNSHNRSITKFFDFPSEVSVPCEQYLLYFSQFLRDLGVEATSDLKHEAGRLLFTVTPANAEEALDSIQAALSIYLALPANPIGEPSIEDEIEVQKLSANIDHLKGQLRLSQAENRANESALKLQQFHIQQMQRLLGGEVLLESMKDVTPRSEEKDTEELMGGLLTLGQLEKGGVKLNLAKIFRSLRERFGKGQLPPKDDQS